MSENCFALHSVSFDYQEGRSVLKNVDVAIPRGHFVRVAGPSGAGKSTLLRLLCRLEEPARGSISFMDKNLSDWATPDLRRKAAYIQQTPVVSEGTVRDNLLLPFIYAANRNTERPEDDLLRWRLDSLLLQDVALDDMADELSVGQKQRVCLIRSLLLSPRALLLDEPTSALDPESARIVLDTAAEMNREDVTVVLVTHDERHLAKNIQVLALDGKGGLFYD